MLTKSLYCSVRGSSHILTDKVCQDASYAHFDAKNGIAIALVADGHGDPRCARSDLGAWLAVEIANWALRSFAKDYKNVGCSGKERDNRISQLFASILYEWRRGIAYDLDIDQKLLNREQLHLYGCTLMGYLQTPAWWLAFQIGDGKLLVRDKDGKWSQPVPWDDSCVVNITTSMCQEDALHRFRYHFSDGDSPSAACLGSDGIDDTFGDGVGLEQFYNHLLDSIITDGLSTVQRQLPRALKHYSQVGSHDDMSISTIINF